MANRDEILKAKERYHLIKEKIDGNSNAGKFLSNLVSSATTYSTHVAEMEAKLARIKQSDHYYKEAEIREELDNQRHYYHEGLLSRLSAFNRFLFKTFGEEVPKGGIYSLNPDSIRDREAVGDWAAYLTMGVKD